jgi:Domain of Unknown Function (DUF1080)
MIVFKRGILCACLIAANALAISAQNQQGTAISLNNLDAFRASGTNWSIGSDAIANPNTKGSMKAIAGTGVLVDVLNPKDNKDILTKEEFGDFELELDFMMAKESNSGVYIQARYEVQLFDSWTKLHPEFSDCGGIYQRWDDARGKGNEGYQGIAPLNNASRAPGLWQHLKLKFQAPQFNAAGVKIRNALFQEVYLNGVLVQLQQEVTGPTRSSTFENEQAMGPLMFQGDHGNVAFRNIQYKALKPMVEVEVKKRRSRENPIFVKADGKPYLLRSFINYEDKKLTHVISGGYPNLLNFSYDLKQGALLQIWRGDFMDVTEMWYERGEPQLAKPLGSVITLSGAPSLAVISDPANAWPDSIAFDDLVNKGYTLDKDRFPSFEYEFKGIKATDKISAPTANSIVREINVSNAPENLYARVAFGKNIEKVGMGLYSIDDKSYYLKLDDAIKPLIRETAHGKEMLVPIANNSNSLTYSIQF